MARNQPIAFVNARVIDPEHRYDGPGCVVVTDGTTLLGADDKAGIAIIMTAGCAYWSLRSS